MRYFCVFRKSLRVFAFLVITVLFLPSCENDLNTIHLNITGKNTPTETMKGVEIIYSDSAKVKMKLTGPNMDRYGGEKPYILFPHGINILFYNDSMKITSRLKAGYGIRYEGTGKMEAKKNVQVVNVKGEKLNTEQLFWDNQKGRIYTNAFVKITTGDEVIYGDGLESNQDFTKWRITNIKGTFNLHDKQQQDTLRDVANH